jgi:hypothetical protein
LKLNKQKLEKHTGTFFNTAMHAESLPRNATAVKFVLLIALNAYSAGKQIMKKN